MGSFSPSKQPVDSGGKSQFIPAADVGEELGAGDTPVTGALHHVAGVLAKGAHDHGGEMPRGRHRLGTRGCANISSGLNLGKKSQVSYRVIHLLIDLG